MGLINVPYSPFPCVLTVKTSTSCPCSHPQQSHDSNHTYSLMSSQYSWLSANDGLCRPRISDRNGGPTRPGVCLCKGGEKWPTQCQLRPFYSQAQKQPCCLHPSGAATHFPCPTSLHQLTSQAQNLPTSIEVISG